MQQNTFLGKTTFQWRDHLVETLTAVMKREEITKQFLAEKIGLTSRTVYEMLGTIPREGKNLSRDRKKTLLIALSDSDEVPKELESLLEDKVDPIFFGKKIQKMRKTKGILQKDLGKLINLDASLISRIERGKLLGASQRELPKAQTLNKIFSVLNMFETHSDLCYEFLSAAECFRQTKKPFHLVTISGKEVFEIMSLSEIKCILTCSTISPRNNPQIAALWEIEMFKKRMKKEKNHQKTIFIVPGNADSAIVSIQNYFEVMLKFLGDIPPEKIMSFSEIWFVKDIQKFGYWFSHGINYGGLYESEKFDISHVMTAVNTDKGIIDFKSSFNLRQKLNHSIRNGYPTDKDQNVLALNAGKILRVHPLNQKGYRITNPLESIEYAGASMFFK